MTYKKRDILVRLTIGMFLGAAVVMAIFSAAYPHRIIIPHTTPSAVRPTLSPILDFQPTTVTSVTIVGLSSSNPTPLPSDKVVTYTVRPGDSLWAIAAHFSTTVEALTAANQLETVIIYPYEVLTIPQGNDNSLVSPATAGLMWRPSILEGDLDSAYPAVLERDRFTLHYTPGTYPAQDPQAVADMIIQGLTHIEKTLDAHLEAHFDVYAAGSLFAPPDQALRGCSFSAARRFFFLHDGTGNLADQQYIVTHELTHLFTWNVFGRPASAMLSEGVAVYTGMSLIADSDHIPLEVSCKAYRQAGVLPSVLTDMSFQGHIRDLENYYTAGCFAQYLIETYGQEKFGQVYPTGDYLNVYDKSLVSLEAEWIAYLDNSPIPVPFDPGTLSDGIGSVRSAYDELFTDFVGTPAEMMAYRELDAARIALVEERFDAMKEHLTAFEQMMHGD